MKLALPLNFILVFSSFMAAHTIDLATHCVCKQLRTIVKEGKSLTDYKHAWYTLLHSQMISLEEKRELVDQIRNFAQDQQVLFTNDLKALKQDPHYGTRLKVVGTLALSSYLISSLIANRIFHITLRHPKASFFFYIPKLIAQKRGFDSLGLLAAFLQLAASATIAPYGIYWACNQIYRGPTDVQLLQEKIDNLTAIITYIGSINL